MASENESLWHSKPLLENFTAEEITTKDLTKHNEIIEQSFFFSDVFHYN